MDVSGNQVTVADNAVESRYEAWVGDQMAYLTYKREDKRINLLHTEVPSALEGRGVASALARTALDDARAQGLAVIPSCEFVAAYIRRHPSYLELVEPAWRHLLERRER